MCATAASPEIARQFSAQLDMKPHSQDKAQCTRLGNCITPLCPRHASCLELVPLQQEFGRSGGQWHSLAYSQKTNAAVQTEPQGDFELCCGLLIPLYAARATEEVFYGKRGVTLGTAQEVCISHPFLLLQNMSALLLETGNTHPRSEINPQSAILKNLGALAIMACCTC